MPLLEHIEAGIQTAIGWIIQTANAIKEWPMFSKNDLLPIAIIEILKLLFQYWYVTFPTIIGLFVGIYKRLKKYNII